MTLAIPYSFCRCCRLCRRARHRAFSTVFYNWSPARNSSYYDLLGIKQDANLQEIKQAFFSKSKKLHPDSDPANPDLHSQFVKLNEAYQVLSNESRRRIYDSFQTAPGARPAPGSHHGSNSKRSPFGFAEFGKRSAPEPDENLRYWQQFQQAPSEPFSGPEVKRKHRQNRRLFGYCILLMVGSLVVHYIGFRKLEDLHNSFMDEKDRAITQIYNENKERARSLGLQRQQELLQQKHAEFARRHQLLSRELPRGALDSGKDQPPPTSTAK
ncbi:dnaJ homolog subfamily C member 4 [Rhineura floridana]|uniref:dnaJ homolog subfamily C member 4 n=1 Tax=Rhineura floridana TaxID=261503 RepID=UPI002AC846DB|nr:dnaJ homolog subfamily C member 4 [Rhineura floridana]XP_061461649.1 dnaJ homolog subfamily C member 4 [Rhineura floridana]XP_061461650.1 dnaJ homolog subfamily C member 4 [Rhineura floridana]